MNTPSCELAPSATIWASLIRPPDDTSVADRAALGLPTDKPIIFAGHQGGLWHAGIAAKLLAAFELANRIDGHVAWLVIDTSDDDPLTFRAPTRDASGRYTDTTLRLDDIESLAHSHDRHQLTEIADAWARHAATPNPFERATRVAIDRLGIPLPSIVRSSDFHRTNAFATLVDLFAVDPARARARYNDAVRQAPESGVAPLREGQIPFWRLTPSGSRLPARDSDLEGPLAPRALITTAVARMAIGDLFIHGSGGGKYEPINDRWLNETLNRPLAPFVTATATLRLRFDGQAITPAEAQLGRWRAHHARHHPTLLGDSDAQAARDQLARRIESIPSGSPSRTEAFTELHAVLERARIENADRLDELTAEADRLAERATEHALRRDRTWPAALHERADIEALHERIQGEFNQ